MSARHIQHPWITDVIDTSDAAVTVAAKLLHAPPDGAHARVEIEVQADDRTTGESCHGIVVGVFGRDSSGAVTLHEHAGDRGWVGSKSLKTALGAIELAVVCSVLNGKVSVSVRGVAGRQLEWLLSAKYHAS